MKGYPNELTLDFMRSRSRCSWSTLLFAVVAALVAFSTIDVQSRLVFGNSFSVDFSAEDKSLMVFFNDVLADSKEETHCSPEFETKNRTYSAAMAG